MLFQTASALALAALAAAATEPAMMMMSTRELFGLDRRAGPDNGYLPTQKGCGTGTTCAQACGAGFDTCASNDKLFHCYNVGIKQVCCSDGTGNSCDPGYYCASSPETQKTLCCKEGQTLAECANTNGVKAASSEYPTAAPSSTSSSAPAPVVYSPAASATASSSAPSYPYSVAANSSVAYPTGHASSSCASTIAPAATYPGANSTKGSAPTPSPSKVTVSAGAIVGPAAGALALAAAVFAAFL